MQKEVKLLLLGAGASGKSTVLKQMRVLHDRPFTGDEVEDYRCVSVLKYGSTMLIGAGKSCSPTYAIRLPCPAPFSRAGPFALSGHNR